MLLTGAGGLGSKIALFQIDNGNWEDQRIIHWCCGCCASSGVARRKLERAYVDCFCRAVSPPLLYRWKHFEPAKAYVTRGIQCRKLLPRVLSMMRSGVKLPQQQGSDSDSDLDDASSAHSESDVGDDPAVQQQQRELTEIRQTRLVKTCAFLQSGSAVASLTSLTLAVRPIEHIINKFLANSADRTELRRLLS
eukprot:14482872-Alexandrium_andersonii.AAC.1